MDHSETVDIQGSEDIPSSEPTGTCEDDEHILSSTMQADNIEDASSLLPDCEEVDSYQSECEQWLELWSVYQRAAAEQFAALAGLYDQLETAAPGTARDSPRAAGGRARLAVRYTTCKQLHASSQQQSASLAIQVRQQLRMLTARLRRCRAAFVAIARLVQWSSPDSAAVCPEALVPAVRAALVTLTERADTLTAELSEVTGRLERTQQRLQETTDRGPDSSRSCAQSEDRERHIELLQTRADNARAQSEELQTQLAELRETSSAALSRSVSRLETLEMELLEAHTRYRDSQRELYQTRSRLSREVAALRSERDTLAVRVDRFQRLTAADAQHSALQKEAATAALRALTADRRLTLSRLSEAEAERSRLLAGFEQAKRAWQIELQRVDRTELVDDLRGRLEGSERRLTEMDAEHRDTSAALREELALRTSQIADLTAQLQQAKRTIVEQEVQNDYLQQRLEDRGDSPPPSDLSQAPTARLSTGSVSDSRLARTAATAPRGQNSAPSDSSSEERDHLRRQVARLTTEREEAVRTTDMLRTELRVALEALQNQRREADLRLMSSSDTRIHELGHMEQQNRELRALATRWQLRAEASERVSREISGTLEQERTKRLEMESSLVEASDKMREIQQQLERQDQYSTWAKLNQSLQLKQVESVMLSLLKVAPRCVSGVTNSPRDAAPPSGGGGEVAPPSRSDPVSPRGILKRRHWSPPPASGADCSGGSLTSTDAEVEVGTDASLATTEPERFEELSGQPCDSDGDGDPL
ncbi:centrosome-associated protein CEP250-like isoform X2 [Amphibalanus amphitrite]|nr:centrosome-associated protein CEP250-like isoform X2 [Amphibalanus amphitrite]XP_043204131.1 centrosome-associated protein CEP250-like isoform X2 [Amphibalanus amphitrite]